MSGSRPPGVAHLEVTIKDFGPISRGVVALKPLTVLMGPNGCGKTHVALLLRSVLALEGRRIDWDLKGDHWKFKAKNGELYHGDVSPSDILDAEARRIRERARTDTAMDSDICAHVDRFWVKSFSHTLLHDTGGFHNKIRHGKSIFELGVKTDINSGTFRYGVGADTLDATQTTKTNLRVAFKEYGDISEMDSDRKLYWSGRTVVRTNIPHISDEDTIRQALKRAVEFRATPAMRRCVYFPAERSGLNVMRGYLANRQVPRRKIGIRPIPRMAKDFLGQFDGLGGDGDYSQIAERFEAEALGGRITAKFDGMAGTWIYYEREGHHFDMEDVASSIRDVALFVVYVKHAARPGDLVILEEPEINLHPAAQMSLARFIARLANAGLWMVVSTHSPYFLEQLSHCVVGGSIRNEARSKILSHDECLRPGSVAAYRFDPDGNGYRTAPVKVTGDGIPQTEFTSVDRKLYAELTKLRQAGV